MKERGKAVESENYSDYNNYNYSCSSDLPCKKHPSSSNIGICAQCLKDRLIKLVCSDCGEQRLSSSCSCSDISSSYRNSSSTIMEVGSVGRISFLIENDKSTTESTQNSAKPLTTTKKDHGGGAAEVILLKRSNSCCAEVKKSQGFWKLGKFFKKKNVKGSSCSTHYTPGCDYMEVSRSRSLCSFRGSVGHFTDQEGSEFAYSSSAKISDVNLNDSEPRKSGVTIKKGVVKESDFRGMDESGFIDLKLDLSTNEYKSAFRKSEEPLTASDFAMFRGEKFLEEIKNEGYFGNERGLGSCRISVNERGIKKGGKGNKVWKWIFKSQHGWRSSSSRKKDVNELFNV